MEYILLTLLIILIICMIMVIVLLKYPNRQTTPEWNQVINQIHLLQKEQMYSSKSIEIMEKNIRDMNRVMTNTKQRGNWGEYQLEHLLSLYAGQNPEVFEMQYTLNNGKIADAVFHLPNNSKILCIDSKFPMENYLEMIDDDENKEYYFRQLKQNMKKHIDDISNKYITTQTMNQAILFIPSEAIYQFVCAKCEDIMSYALKKHVFLTSPTTLVGITFTLIASTKDFYRASHLEEIEENLLLLQEDVVRLVTRSEKAEKSLESLANQFHGVSTSAKKIGNRIDKITGGEA